LKKKLVFLSVFFVFISCKDINKSYRISTDPVDSLDFFSKEIVNDNLDINFKKSLSEKILKITDRKENTQQIRNLLFNVLTYQTNTSEYYKFDQIYSKLLSKSSKAKDTLNIANAYRYKAAFFRHKTIYDSAFYYYFKAEKLFVILKDRENLGNILLNKGITQFYANDFLKADVTASKAYTILKDFDDKYRVYATLNILGAISNELKDYKKALFYNEEALKVVENNNIANTYHPKETVLNNIGNTYQLQKKYKKAIQYFKIALQNKKLKNEAPDLYILLLENLAYSKMMVDDYSNLPDMFYESLKLSDSLDLYSNEVYSYIHLSEYYAIKKDTLKAFDCAKNALKKAKITNLPVDILTSLKQCSIVNPPNLSNKYSLDYIRINDSLQLVERKSQEKFARIQLETDEIIKEKDDLEGKSKNYFYLIIGLVVFGGGFFVIRNQITRTKILQYKQAQQAANEEIFNLMMSQQSEIDATRSKEKRKISRDLHDGVLGRLFGARLSLESLNTLEDEDSVTMRHNYIEELKKIEQDIREISHDLNREKLEVVNNFVAIVTALVEEQNKNHSANTTLTIDPTINWNTINSIKKINTYRIIQEALQNCNKYAQADTIFVTIAKENTHYKISVKDNGVGYDVNKKGKGIGTKNMIERTEECKGIFEVNSKFGEGSEVIVMMPLDDEQSKPNQTV
jgi:signal transduction histidine kinase